MFKHFNKIYIIGGLGVIGKLLHQRISFLYEEANVVIFDKGDKIIIENGTPSLPNLVIISTPISEITKTMRKLVEINPRHTYVIEIGSVKSPIVKTCLDIMKSKKCHIMFNSVHPMAGVLSSWNIIDWGKTCLFIEVDNVPFYEPIKDFLLKMKFVIKNVKYEDHDKVLAKVSHLSHFMIMKYVDFCKKTLTPKELEMAGTSFEMFEKLADGARRLQDIYDYNKELPKVIEDFSKNLSE